MTHKVASFFRLRKVPTTRIGASPVTDDRRPKTDLVFERFLFSASQNRCLWGKK